MDGVPSAWTNATVTPRITAAPMMMDHTIMKIFTARMVAILTPPEPGVAPAA